jgi:cysteine-rich repeat protein
MKRMSPAARAMAASIVLLVAACSGGDEAKCGDGRVEGNEACDDGRANADGVPGACRTDCRAPRCGDGVVDPGEGCDDGVRNGQRGACRATCVAPFCGDGLTDPGEQCDWGGANDDTRVENCRTNCRLPYCGDGVLKDGEDCDDGAANSDVVPDACRTDCTVSRCGDGTLDTGEACDDGARNNAFAADACRPGCVLPACGDRVVDLGEDCDDGEPEGRDGCDPLCRYALPATCGAPGLPLRDLRVAGTADAGGFVATGTLPAGLGLVEPGTCGGAGTEAFYAFPIAAQGDLVLDLEGTTPGFVPVLSVLQACPGNVIACTGGVGGGPVRLVVPDLWPARGAVYLQVDGAGEEGGGYRLSVHLRPPLGAGDACATDGHLGRCDPLDETLGCADPDGDGLGSCVRLVGDGGACDPAGATDLCRPPDVCREGTCRPACGDGVRQAWEACDDGNVAGGDLCSSACQLPSADCADPVPLNLLWDPASGRSTWVDDTGRVGHVLAPTCGTQGVGTAGRFVAPQAGRYAFTLGAAFDGAVVSVLGSCGEAPAELACGSPGAAAEVELVADQEVYFVVASSEPGQMGSFTATLERVVCGDGIVRGAEECDDGNLLDGDRCRADCTWPGDTCADPYPLPPPDAVGATGWSADFAAFEGDPAPTCVSNSGQDAIAAFIAPAAGRYSFEAVGQGNHVILSVRTGSCADGPVQGCVESPYPVVPAVVEASLAAGETAFVSVARRLTTRSFSLAVTPLVCGDGRRARPEECDDGNLVAGDGCDPSCVAEPVAEQEPNDVRARAQPLPVGRVLAGALPAGDLDYVALDLTAGGTYVFQIFQGGWEECLGAGGPTTLDLHGPNGELLAQGDPLVGLGGKCPGFSFVAPAAGTYFLRVEATGDAVPEYLLHTGTLPP